MTRFHVGAVVERLPGPRYREALTYTEYAPGSPPPRPSTLAKWRAEMGPELEVALVAPRDALGSAGGSLRASPQVEAAMGWLGEALAALGACALVVPTGSDLTTGQRDRDRLAAWVQRCERPAQCALVWHPAGLWEAPEALRLATRLGIEVAGDPLAAPLPRAARARARLRGVGAHARLSEGVFLQTKDALEATGAGEAYVSIESARSFKEAVRLRALLEDADG